VSIEHAEELVRLLPQVTGCRIRTDERGEPVAVLVTARPGSQAGAVLADVLTVLGAQAGLDVLDDQVHVAVLEERAEVAEPGLAAPDTADDAGAPLLVETLEQEGRVRLLSYSTHVAEERTRTQVELALGDRPFWGEAESRGAGEVPELLAEACLDALERLCHGRVSLRLAGWKRTVLGATEVVGVLVQESWGRESRWLTGSAIVGDDLSRATTHAVLDSMNRRLGRILATPPLDFEIRIPEA